MAVLPFASISIAVYWAWANRSNAVPGPSRRRILEVDQPPALHPTRDLSGTVLVWLFIVPYILARLFILVEIFRTLFFLPPEAFINT
jgi:hypothetical protein